MISVLEPAEKASNRHSLLPHHRQQLLDSGLTDETIEGAGVYSVCNQDEMRRILQRKNVSTEQLPALAFPYPSTSGEMSYTRVKPDKPRYIEDKAVKYESPSGVSNEIYLPPGVSAVLQDTSVALFITEGEKKSLAAKQRGFSCIGLVGVYGWKVKDREELLPSMQQIAWGGRDVFIVFDSDLTEKRDVQNAEERLARLLTKGGANVKLMRLPPGEQMSGGRPVKVGLDDYLLTHSDDEFRALMSAAIDSNQVATTVERPEASKVYPECIAAEFLQWCKVDGFNTIATYRGDLLEWKDGGYRRIADDELRRSLVLHMNQRYSRVRTRETGDVMAQVKAQAAISGDTESPSWLAPQLCLWPAREVLPCRNKLVHIPSFVSNEEYAKNSTPRFFTMTSLDYDFDASPPEPKRWLAFLNQLWPNEPDSIATIQQWFGYCLTFDTRQQKMLALIGPPRSGKGTLTRVLQRLVGEANFAGPTLASLATTFGLAPLVNKSLAVISDARLSGRADSSIIVERLLSISGEDTLTIDRKHMPPITVKLPTRLVLVSNELPKLNDASNALASRMVIVPLKNSFLGHEDPDLWGKLQAEIPGIVLWAIHGWDELRKRGRFSEPASAASLRTDLKELSSPVSAFVQDKCVLAPGETVVKQKLYESYCEWCRLNGHNHCSQSVFGRNLKAAHPEISGGAQQRAAGKRERCYSGVRLVI